jgi:DNA-directed RNA polymerase omega subunit
MSHIKNTTNRFEFVVTAGARARQLLAGSIPRVEVGDHKKTTIARKEVSTKAVEKIQPSEIPDIQ